MNYQETCEYLFNQLPMFERQGASGYKEGLSNTLALDEHLGHPHRSFASIHVGGTNGKGSVSHTLAAILQECGYQVGLYTSPHLVDFRERIKVNGQPVSEEYVVSFIDKHRNFFEPLKPTFFELTTALAFSYFKYMNVDIAIVEVGLGGRLDCTNIITPVVSVITNISYDHTQFLGDTLAKIAAEKAGIIKHGVPVVIGESNAETRPVFEAKAKEMNAPIIFADDTPEILSATIRPEGGMNYVSRHVGQLSGDLGGIYQKQNLNTVTFVAVELSKLGFLSSFEKGSPDDVKMICRETSEGISHVVEKTGLMGRWQIVRQSPKVICDTGHNVGGWQYISKQLQMTPCRQMHIVFGMVDDKDVDGVLELLPKQAKFYFTKADSHRAINEQKLQALARTHGIEGIAYPTVVQAYQAALAQAAPDDLVFVGGSSYVVGDFLKSCN